MVEAGRNGMYATAVVGAILLAVAAYSLLSGGEQSGEPKAKKGLAGQQFADSREGLVLSDASGPGADVEVHSTSVRTHLNQDELEGLKPMFREKVEAVLSELEKKGWQPIVAEGRRTLEEQAAKVTAGKSLTLDSAHVKGYAADIVDRRWGWSGPAAKHSFRFWHDLGAAAKRQGLVWGGSWKRFPDPAHVEMPNWRALP